MSEIIVTGDRQYVPKSTSSLERFRFYQEDGSGKLSVQITRDGGVTWKAIASEPPSNAGVGWTPTIAENGTIRWMSPLSILSKATTAGDGSQMWVDFSFPAELQSDAAFGMFEVPAGITIQPTAIQISLFTAPERSDIKVSIENATTGAQISEIGSINLGINQTYNSSTFTTNFEWVAGTKVRARIESFTGSESLPGSFLVARLIFKRI